MRRLALAVILGGLGGCAGIDTAVLSASLTLAVQALKLDTAIVEYWTAKEKAPKPPDPPIAEESE